jgi:hypothetical protein
MAFKMINENEYQVGILIAVLSSLLLWSVIFTAFSSCSTGRPLLNQPQIGLYDSDGRYMIAYPYAHNPKKLMFIPFIDPDYKENPQAEPEDF